MSYKRFYVDYDILNNDSVLLEGDEHNHLKNVMRLQKGANVIVVCNNAFDYLCEVLEVNKNCTKLKVLQKTENLHNPKTDITVFQCLTKNDNMNLIVQKLTELGVLTFIPFESRFSTVKIKDSKTEKWQKISNQSLKQCKRSVCMEVSKTLKFDAFLNELNNYDLVIFANECEDKQKLDKINLNAKKIALIVGSEGGFSSEEIELIKNKNAVSISLGNRILRAETASVVLTALVMHKFGEI